ncbi:molybdopterin-dependent oxidoreductase [Skermanella mucosa]|uniref:molybdopterin-dependent oxidoreductase n=1 Tax=Skermanella mucosa TaxID=1789672 RepID=UPI00192AC0DA|nr:molybdopterin-dependent oxidoreductase [Skermanella mucosa]UEM18809.1 molybdopterin-dependent oxidoreductase [Skermanella mucosa]
MSAIYRAVLSLAAFSLILWFSIFQPGPAAAGTLAVPSGPVVLTVSGKITQTNGAAGAEFDLAMLEALPGRVAKVTTPWAEGVNAFEGPLARAVLQAAGAQGSKLRITALNDYSAEVPLEDFLKFDVILALKKNDAYLPVRHQGPIFVIYPFDINPDLYNEVYFGRSVWQVKSIEVQ